MKLLSSILAFVLFIVFSSFTNKPFIIENAPQKEVTLNGSFTFFRIHRQAKDGVTATWGFTPGSNVTGFRLERTYGDPTDPYSLWEVLTDLPYTDSRSYKFTDRPVEPGFITYRVIAVMNTGEEISSELLTQHIVSR